MNNMQDYVSAEKWLMEHKDLWENGKDGIVFLTDDTSQIPDNVKEYVNISNETVNEFEQALKIMNMMSK